jgi:uncharacterized protein YecE (DUF72 family)
MKTGRLFVGTSGWNYPHWRTPFYEGARAQDFLSFYCQRLDSVEVNKSFYRLLSSNETRQWAAQTPDNFLFAVKGSRFITHMLKLKEPRRALRRFFTPLKYLKDRLGPILFQLPPRWKKNYERLENFIAALPPGHRYAFELREPSWIVDDVLELFRRNKIAFCIYDFDGRQTPRHVTAKFTYIRLHGPGARYQGLYTAEQLAEWSRWIQSQRDAGVDVYCYFDNDQNAFAVRNAVQLKKLSG